VMIRRIICRLFGHEWRQSIMGTCTWVCKRCHGVEYRYGGIVPLSKPLPYPPATNNRKAYLDSNGEWKII